MMPNIDDLIKTYLRALSEKRFWLALIGIVVAAGSLTVAATLPKSYTASASIYADNSNILQPLMQGNAVTTGLVNQARMARDILFSREFTDPILDAAGIEYSQMSLAEKEQQIKGIQGRTSIINQGRGPASLIVISHTDQDPVRAFRITQRYTSIFIEESVSTKQLESRSAFEFIERQVGSYQLKLQESENNLSNFKSANNLGTLANANNRIATYRADIEELDLELVQIDTQIESVESQLAGENEVAKDMSEVNSIRARQNALEVRRDALRSTFHDSYPDVVQINNQIADLQAMLETVSTSTYLPSEDLDNSGATTLHQELRSRLAILRTTKEARTSQRNGIRSLLAAEEDRARRINETEAELAELTRDYNVTQDFYNSMLARLENARVSMQLDEEQQGLTFKIQESAVIPTQPDGMGFTELMGASFILAMGVPFGLMVTLIQLDPRVRTEANFKDNWPPLLASVPPLRATRRRWISDNVFVVLVFLAFLALYGIAAYLNITGYIQ